VLTSTRICNGHRTSQYSNVYKIANSSHVDTKYNIHHFVYHSYANRESRVKGLTSILENFDVIALQEVFILNTPLLGPIGTFGRQTILENWKYHSAVPHSPPYFQQDSGLMILSKYPILKTWSIAFTNRGVTEIVNQKGALMAAIQVGDKTVHVINTHLDAKSAEIRALQINQICVEFLGKQLRLQGSGIELNVEEKQETKTQTDVACVLVGDLNSNAMFQGNSDSTPVTESLSEFSHVSDMLLPLKDARFEGAISYERTHALYNVCLDHVFVHKVNVDYSTFKTEKSWADGNGVSISDHYGVSFNFTL